MPPKPGHLPVGDSKQALVRGILACLVSALVLAALSGIRFLAPLDDSIYDTLLHTRAGGTEAGAASGIVLITVDEESMAVLNRRWPWPRSIYAQALDRLFAAGVRAVGIDLLFLEASEDSADDESLAAALARHPKVVVAAKFEGMERRFVEGGVSLSGRRLVLPHPRFRPYSRYGIINLELGSGGVVRSFRSTFAHQGESYPSFGGVLHEIAFGVEPRFPAEGSLRIDYRGPPGSFPRFPAYQLLDGTVPDDALRNKVVLLGVTFSDAHDLFPTPFTDRPRPSSGVEVQANILSSIRRGTYPRPVARWLQLVLVLALSLFSGYLILFRSGTAMIASYAAMLVVGGIVAPWLMEHKGVFMDLSYLAIAMPLTFALVSLPMRKPLVLETRVGPYKLLEELGRGGMAVVYRAVHPKTRAEVALKRLLPQYATDADLLQRFLREIELIRGLDHPNIVRIIDAGEVNGQPYYAMEYIKGRTLDEVRKETIRLDQSDVRRIGGAVARALARAHEVGVIHRDVKPSNILLTDTGMPKLADFGVARRLDSPGLTVTGRIVGTPHYIAPELCEGKSPSPASDIYSLGATLYVLLAGRPPFVSKDPSALIAMILSQVPPDIRSLRQEVHPDLADLVMECMRRDPAKRPPDMLSVAARLDPFYTEIAAREQGESGTVAEIADPSAGEAGTQLLGTLPPSGEDPLPNVEESRISAGRRLADGSVFRTDDPEAGG